MKSLKITRWYDDACGTAHALELVGERWALLVMRELMFGPRRFGDLRASLPGLSANVLTQRLAGLEAAGIVVRRTLPPPASVRVYELTAWGQEAEPIVQTLGRWAARSPGHDPTLPLSPVSLMMSFRTMFVAALADRDLGIGFRFGEESFVARIEHGALAIERGSGDVTTVSGTPEAVAAIVYGDAPVDSVSVVGDLATFERFARLFVLPPKVDATSIRSH